MNNKDKYGNSEAWKRGEALETKFFELYKSTHPNARRSTRQEQFKHIDIVDGETRIDVKARKRVSKRGNYRLQTENTWLEFKDTAGNPGWLFGEASHIAFELDDGFLIVQRQDLANLAKEKCDVHNLVQSPTEALYKGFSRPSRDDLISMIKTDDMLDLKYDFLCTDGDII